MYLYGYHTVKAALENPKRQVQQVYTSKPQDFPIKNAITVEAKYLDKLVANVNHQGIVAQVTPLPMGHIETVEPRVLILDQITDPQNFGAIVRSAATFGFYDVVVRDYEQLIDSPVMARVASGAVEHVRIVGVTNIARAIEELKEQQFWVYGLDERGAQSLRQCKFPEKSAIVIGSEGYGLRPLTQKQCDALLHIPHHGDFCVLNASHAAGIAMYEVLSNH
ncbi:MAG: 23S rRNA (guanosine(2251)-2'-O)-methyltransferase RlmB [Pseudomonadota bacterium]|mgnify:CR=1 FL=1